jgi:glycosyltransferase involved in cell wall biosynthesis
MKKVAILIYSLGGGGAERVVSTLLNKLSSNFDISLVMMNDEISYDIPQNTKIHYLEKSSSTENNLVKISKLPWLAWKFRSFCKKNNIDVCLSFCNRANYINILSKVFGNSSKIITSERTSPSTEYGPNTPKNFINRVLIKSLYPQTDLMVPNAFEMGHDLKTNFGVSSEITVINNPVDIEKIETLQNEKVEFDFSKFTFINVGRLIYQKNQKGLLDAFAALNKENSQLIILGEGTLEKELKEKVVNLNIEHKVHFLGFDNNPYKYLSKADCFVLNSEHEGFPNVVIEALACGLPVISSDCPTGPRELLAPDSDLISHVYDKIEYAKYGILVPVKDSFILKEAMEIIYDNEKLAQKYRKTSKLRAMDYKPQNIVKKFEAIFED